MKSSSTRYVTVLCVLTVTLDLFACTGRQTPRDTNLLVNASFEETHGNVPVGWKVLNFRGLPDMKPALYGTVDTLSVAGARSFYFSADDDTKRFYTLTQELRVEDIERIRLRGRIRSVDIRRNPGQFPQANLALTFYDNDRNRFQSARFADRMFVPTVGTSEGWVEVDKVFRVPRGTAYVELHCVLGMAGTLFFDDLSLEVPLGPGWMKRESDLFTHYWLPEKEYPEGSIAYQLQLVAQYATKLGIAKDEVQKISYYLYPDTTAMQNILGTTKVPYVDYDGREIHSTNPVDTHEVIHLLTHPYGVLPTMLAEGTAFYLLDDYKGESILPLAQKILLEGNLPSLKQLLNPFGIGRMNPDRAIPAAASFVGFILEYGGADKFIELHTRLSAEAGYDAFANAFNEVYPRSLVETEAAWRRILASAEFSTPEKQSDDGQSDENERSP